MTTEFVTRTTPARTGAATPHPDPAPARLGRRPRHRAPARHLIGGASIPVGLVLTLAVVALVVRACT